MEVREKIAQGIAIDDLPLRVVFYARVSTENDLQATSITNQIEYFSNYIKNNKNWTFIGGYVDEGISGKSVQKREKFLKMIEDAKKKQFDLILTKSVSRFARNTIDSIRYTDILRKYEVGVVFVNDNINTFYSDSEFRLTLMASIAQDELRKLSESVQFGLNQSIERGIVLGNNNILGYKKNHGKLIVVEKESQVVKDVFKLFITEKYNYSSLAKKINVKYHTNYDSGAIKRILTNYKYKGYYCGRKSKITDYKQNIRKKIKEEDWLIYKDYETVPPIVSEQLWNKVNKIIQKNKIMKKQSKQLFLKYKGHLFCKEHQKILMLKKKKYYNKCYGYLVCQNCISLSTSLLDRIWTVYPFRKIIIFKDKENTLQLKCQK